MKEKEKSGMLKKAIENWLINTNERNYLPAFCQILLNEGKEIIYISQHGEMEQGKDIIAIDRKGRCYAYQLKTGVINLNVWRKIRGEIEELTRFPPIHPSIDKRKIHKSFLVTNRYVTDSVRIQIDQMNEDNRLKRRKYSCLLYTSPSPRD